MAMNVGKLNKRITFMGVTQENDEYGDHPTRSSIRTVWANVKAVRGGEYYEAQRIRPELTYKITCRWFNTITPDMTIDYEGREFQIVDVIDIDEEHTWWEIRATEVIKKKVTA